MSVSAFPTNSTAIWGGAQREFLIKAGQESGSSSVTSGAAATTVTLRPSLRAVISLRTKNLRDAISLRDEACDKENIFFEFGIILTNE